MPSPLLLHVLEPRCLLSAAFDLIGLSGLRADPQFAGIDGSGVSVAVIDTGIGSHSLLGGGAVVAREDFVRSAGSGRYNQDENSHGTHVAGTVGARDPDIGVALGVSLIGLKVGGLDGSGAINATAVERAFEWVLDHRDQYNIVAVNMSIGGGFYGSGGGDAHPYFDDVQALEAAGITVVAAAGNEYDVNKRQGSSAPGVFATLNVGAVYDENEGRVGRSSFLGGFEGDRTTAADRTVYFSHRPNTANVIFAPGALITSTVPGDDFDDKPGTSMAAPHVAGVVALMQEAANQFGGRYLQPGEVAELMTASADEIIDGDDEDTTVQTTGLSYPRVNAHEAVRAVRTYFLRGDPDPDPAPPPPNTTDPDGLIVDAQPINVTRNVLIDAGIIGNDGATVGGNGTITGGQEIGGDDVDIYELLIPDNGVLRIDVDTPADIAAAFPGRSHVNSALRVFNTAGTELVKNDNAAAPTDDPADGHTTDSYLALNVTRGQRLYVAVSDTANQTYNPTTLGGRASGPGGYYQLQLTYSNRDLNGAIPQATGDWTIDVGTATTFARGILGADGDASNVVGDLDVDFNHVNSPVAGILEVDIDSHDIERGTEQNLPDWLDDLFVDPVDTVLHLWSSDGTLLATVDDVEGLDPVLRYPIAPGVDYFVSVSGYGNDHFDPFTLGSGASGGTGNYALKVRLRNAGDTTQLTDDDVRNPAVRTLTPDAQQTGEVGVDNGYTVGATDVDFYRFVPDADGVATCATSDVNDFDVDTVLRVFDAAGTELAFNDDADDATASSRASTFVRRGQVYYVGVNGAGPNARDYDIHGNNAGAGDTGAYALAVAVAPPPVDVMTTVASTTLPATVVPGDKGKVVVSLGNAEPGRFRGAVSIGVYLSTDSAIGGDVLIGSVSKALSLKPGVTRAFNVKAYIPPNAAPGAYNVLAVADLGSATNDVDLANNTATLAQPRALAWRFGTVDGRANVRTTLMDSAGVLVTFAMKGAGYGDVSRAIDGVFNLVLADTDASTSAARITTDIAASAVNDVFINGGLRELTAPTIDLLGDVTTSGSRGPLVFRNVTV